MQTPYSGIKTHVKTQEYHSYVLRQSLVWDKLGNDIQESIDVTSDAIGIIAYKRGFGLKDETELELEKELQSLEDKLSIVRQRAALLESEWNRVEYHLHYKFDQIEVLPELVSSFFSFFMQEVKSGITYN